MSREHAGSPSALTAVLTDALAQWEEGEEGLVVGETTPGGVWDAMQATLEQWGVPQPIAVVEVGVMCVWGGCACVHKGAGNARCLMRMVCMRFVHNICHCNTLCGALLSIAAPISENIVNLARRCHPSSVNCRSTQSNPSRWRCWTPNLGPWTHAWGAP